ncbi:MAG TPA: hypothetical protein VNF73_15875 [Candidatus Saccharimonadales bacterium]|nr:hypothetical protein [Candidatus Saccharimonadales bacterium]
MKRMLIGFSERQHQRLREQATARHVSVATLVRDAVERAYPDGAEERRLAHLRSLSAIGRFHSGRSDISERHDDYLAEAYAADLDRW